MEPHSLATLFTLANRKSFVCQCYENSLGAGHLQGHAIAQTLEPTEEVSGNLMLVVSYEKPAAPSSSKRQPRVDLQLSPRGHGHGDGPKLRSIHKAVRRSQVHFVQRVERFAAQLEIEPFRQPKRPL